MHRRELLRLLGGITAGSILSIAGLREAAAIAEEHQVTLCLELLNSKVDDLNYQGDHTAFGLEVVRVVGASHVSLLYDIYPCRSWKET